MGEVPILRCGVHDMSIRIEVTPEMVRRARMKYLDLAKGGRANANDYAHMMLEAALNPPDPVCPNCKQAEGTHIPLMPGSGMPKRCNGYVWEASE